MKKPVVFLVLFYFSVPALARQTDSLQQLEEVRIRAFEQYRPPNSSTAAVRLIATENSDRYNKSSLVNSFNSIAGVRMEERSPGSYRISIRGSSLRSPFGVRNIKVYWNDIPVTDPGGNTYFNQFAWNSFSSIELFKGPVASLYGAGTGGLLLMHSLDEWRKGLSLEYVTGSYGLQNVFAEANWGEKENRNRISFAHNQSNGYRQQSAMRRDNFSWSSRLVLNERQQLTASLLYTDLFYETPGGLNLSEYQANPRAARPAAGAFPSAEDAKAAIRQRNFLAGFSHRYRLSNRWQNHSVVYGSFTRLRNAAVRNYERRVEPQWGGRTAFVWEKETLKDKWQWVAGAEFQQGDFNTYVADNIDGRPGALQTNDDVGNQIFTGFLQTDYEWKDRWTVTAGASIHRSRVVIRRLSSTPVTTQSRRYQNEISPRLAILHKLSSRLFVLGTVSRGFSPPTTAEVLPSTGVISTELEAEKGWNYELTVRYQLLQNRLQLEATAFHFDLRDALVQRRDAGGADFFTNAGRVSQKGIETQARYQQVFAGGSFIRSLLLQTDWALNHFRYRDFIKGTDDFSGNKVPSVPAQTVSLLANLDTKAGLYLQLTYYSASAIYLNDANTAKSEGYQLLGSRVGWSWKWNKENSLQVYVGADNIFDEKYSLGNDINAAAGRYYNAAAGRNFYFGIRVKPF